jgi:hypothetical protein
MKSQNEFTLPQTWTSFSTVFSGARGRDGRRFGGRCDNSLTNTMVRIMSGPWKGYGRRVKDATDTAVRIELDSKMKTITVDRKQLNLKEGRRDETAGGCYAQTPSRAYPQTPSRAYPQAPSRVYPQTPARDPTGEADLLSAHLYSASRHSSSFKCV